MFQRMLSWAVIFFGISSALFPGASFAGIREEARELTKNGNIDGAITLLKNSAEKSENPDLFLDLGSLLGKAEKYAEALDYVGKGIKFFPGNAGLENLRGLLYYKSGKIEQAKASWNAVLKMNPKNSFAAEWIKKIQKNELNQSSANSTEIMEKIKDSSSGSENGSTTLSLDSSSPTLPLEEQKKLAVKIFSDLGAMDKNDLSEVGRLYRELIRKCPDTEQAQESCWRLSNMYLSAYDSPNYNSALEILELFMKRYPFSPGVDQVKSDLLFIYDMLGKHEKLIELYKPSFDAENKLSNEDYVAHGYRYAKALEKIGKTTEANEIYKKILEKDQGRNSISAIMARQKLNK
ncbi:MAG: hypothetical protein HQM08_16550 [Candidatus Riflebacteria bacterium]|nr:hypothetical protein [Candidatus Riflebacteria bacterium]